MKYKHAQKGNGGVIGGRAGCFAGLWNDDYLVVFAEPLGLWFKPAVGVGVGVGVGARGVGIGVGNGVISILCGTIGKI